MLFAEQKPSLINRIKYFVIIRYLVLTVKNPMNVFARHEEILIYCKRLLRASQRREDYGED